MNSLRKRRNTDSNIDSKEEQQGLLRSSKVSCRCSSLDCIKPNGEFVTEEVAIEYLADILVDIFLSYESNNQK